MMFTFQAAGEIATKTSIRQESGSREEDEDEASTQYKMLRLSIREQGTHVDTSGTNICLDNYTVTDDDPPRQTPEYCFNSNGYENQCRRIGAISSNIDRISFSHPHTDQL